jgi:hypothetical protein
MFNNVVGLECVVRVGSKQGKNERSRDDAEKALLRVAVYESRQSGVGTQN